MLTVLTSGKAAPGTTTGLWSLALSWQREIIAVDADPSGGDMSTGLLAGRLGTDRGLLSWSVASRPGVTRRSASQSSDADDVADLLGHAIGIPEQTRLRLVPGFATEAQAASFSADSWDRLARALRQAVDVGWDCLVDTGRLTTRHPGAPLVRAADRVLVVVRPSVRSVRAAHDACSWLRAALGDLTRVSALVVGQGPYSPSQVAETVGLPLAGVLPHDPATAAVLSDGARPRGPLDRSSLLRAGRALGETLTVGVPPLLAGAT